MAGRKKHSNAGPVNYQRPDILVRVPKPHYDYDHDLAQKMLVESVANRGLAHAKPNGTCYSCGTDIPPMRKLCGQCGAKRLHDREWDLK